jgi:hypothetical protein
MDWLLLMVAAVFFLLHLLSETVATFVKYNFSSLGRHMLGVSISNIFAMVSRGFVALFGVIVSIIIERQLSDVYTYVYIFAAASALGALFSFALANLKIERSAGSGDDVTIMSIFLQPRASLSPNHHTSPVPIRGMTAVFLGSQFLSIVIAYGFCFLAPQHRLLIISLVPLVSTVGALITILWVEPRLARMVDADNSTGYAASREFLRARASSFMLGAFMLVVLPHMVLRVLQ